MGNIFEDIYRPPVLEHRSETFMSANPDYKLKQTIPSKIETWDGKYLTEKDLNERLTPLQFGNKKQIRALKLLQLLQDCTKEQIKLSPS